MAGGELVGPFVEPALEDLLRGGLVERLLGHHAHHIPFPGAGHAPAHEVQHDDRCDEGEPLLDGDVADVRQRPLQLDCGASGRPANRLGENRDWPRDEGSPAAAGVLGAGLVLAPCGCSAPVPGVAEAHGIVGRADLPIPVWLFRLGGRDRAGGVVRGAVGAVDPPAAPDRAPQTPAPHSAGRGAAREPARGRRVRARRLQRLRREPGVVGELQRDLHLRGLLDRDADRQLLLGDVFAVLSPWRSCARAIRWLGGRLAPRALSRSPLRYPDRLGQWPAVALLVGFAWLELVYVERDSPSILAALSLGYFLLMLAGMLAFGVETWATSADGFGAYFGLLSRMSPLTVDENGELYARRPLSGLTAMPVRSGTVMLVCAVIGTTTFDGFSNDVVWRKLEPHLQSVFSGFSFHPTPAIELAYTVGLLLCVGGGQEGIYELGIRGVQSVSFRYTRAELSRAFAHTLVPMGSRMCSPTTSRC